MRDRRRVEQSAGRPVVTVEILRHDFAAAVHTIKETIIRYISILVLRGRARRLLGVVYLITRQFKQLSHYVLYYSV